MTPNVDILRLAAQDPDFGRLIRRASLLLVDGAPLEWAGRISGQPHVRRTPGSSLMMPLAREAAEREVPLLLLGGRPGAGETAAAAMRESMPALDVRWHCPPFGFEQDPFEWRRSQEAVAQSTGGIVMCGLGAPKQEYVMSRLIEDFPDTWFLGIGGSIDMTAGYVRRAPGWMQTSGIEWLWRLGVEPRRLFRRYVIEDMPFAASLMSWALRERLSGTFLADRGMAAVAPAAAGPDARILELGPSGRAGRRAWRSRDRRDVAYLLEQDFAVDQRQGA